MRVLLEFGADPNSTALFDDATGQVPPLWRAAELKLWGVCLVLLEKGANSEFKTKQGRVIRDLLRDTEREFPSEGYSTQGHYDRLKQVLR